MKRFVSFAFSFSLIVTAAFASPPKLSDTIGLMGKSEADVVKVLGAPVSTRGGEYFREGTWKFSGGIAKFRWSATKVFMILEIETGKDWASTLKAVGLNPAGVQAKLTSFLGIDGWQKKKTYELKGVKGIAKGMACYWDGRVPEIQFFRAED